MIKLRATVIDKKEVNKLLKILTKNYDVLEISREYENKRGHRESVYKRIYIDLQEK